MRPSKITLFLSNALIKCRQLKLNELVLDLCFLTDKCIPSLCKLLKDKHCKLAILDIGGNHGYSDDGVLMLYEDVLTNDHYKLVRLNVLNCSLTDQCIPWLRKALINKRCVLNFLSIDGNKLKQECKEAHRKMET